MSANTIYLRSKIAEQGNSSAQFDEDGFNRWAETKAPARVGQIEKESAEPTNTTMDGDALRRLYVRHQRRGGRDMDWSEAADQKQRAHDMQVQWLESSQGSGDSVGDGKRNRRHRVDCPHCGADLNGDGWLDSAKAAFKSVATAVKDAASTAMALYDKYKDNPMFQKLSETAKQQALALAQKKGISPEKLGKVSELVSKYGPQAEAMIGQLDSMSGGYARGTTEWIMAKSTEQFRLNKQYRGKKSYDEINRMAEEYADKAGSHGGKGKTRKPSKRNEIVRELMKKEGLSLPEASRQVKLRGLY